MSYTVGLPDGTTAEFPDEVSHDEAANIIKSHMASQQPKHSGVLGAIGRGVESLASDARTTVGSLMGDPNEAAKAGLARQQSIDDRYEQPVDFHKVGDAYDKNGVFSAAKELGSQIMPALGEMSPNIAAGIAGAKAGRILGGEGSVAGGVLGAMFPSIVQRFGSDITGQASAEERRGEQIDVSPGKAAAATAIQAPLDVAAEFVPFGKTIAGKVFGPSMTKFLEKGSTEASEKLAQEALYKTLLKGTAVGAGEQIPIQVTQTMIQRAQAGEPLTGDEAWNAYGQAAYMATLLGPMGAMGRVTERSAARENAAAAEDIKQAETAKAAEAAQPPAETPPAATPATADTTQLTGADLASGDIQFGVEAKDPIAAEKDAAFQAAVDKFNGKEPTEAPKVDTAAEEAKAKAAREAEFQAKIDAIDTPWDSKEGETEVAPSPEAKTEDAPVMVPKAKRNKKAAAKVEETPAAEAEPVETIDPNADPMGLRKIREAQERQDAQKSNADSGVKSADQSVNSGDRGSADHDISVASPILGDTEVADATGLADASGSITKAPRRTRTGKRTLASAEQVHDDVKSQADREAAQIKQQQDEAQRDYEAAKAREQAAQDQLVQWAKERKAARENPPSAPEKDTSPQKTYGNPFFKPPVEPLAKKEPEMKNPQLLRNELHEALTSPFIEQTKQKGGIQAALQVIAGREKGITAEDSHAPVIARLADNLSQMDFGRVKTHVEGESPDMNQKFNSLRQGGVRAEYDPAKNTIYLTSNGLDETTVVHEALHAATRQVIAKYQRWLKERAKDNFATSVEFPNGEFRTRMIDRGTTWNKITRKHEPYEKQIYDHRPQQLEAVQHLNAIFKEARTRIGDKFPNAFRNLDEFVSHAMTEKKIQEALAKEQSKDLAKYTSNERISLWNQITRALAKLFGIAPDTVHGNLMLEASEAMNKILTKPQKQIFGIKDSERFSRKLEAEKKESPPVEIMAKQNALKIDQARSKTHGIASFIKAMGTFEGYETAKRAFQNSRAPLAFIEDMLRKGNRLITLTNSPDANDAYSRISRMGSIATNLVRREVDPHISRVYRAVEKYSKDNNISTTEATERIGLYLMALHEKERREVKYWKNVPLSDKLNILMNGKMTSAASIRDAIFKDVYGNKNLDTATVEKYRDLLKRLAHSKDENGKYGEGVDENGVSPLGGKRSIETEDLMYNVVGGHDKAWFDATRDQLEKELAGKSGNEIREIQDALKTIQQHSIDNDKSANYWSKPVDNIKTLYGYKNYMPLKGNPHRVSEGDEAFEYNGPRTSRELVEAAAEAGGRKTDSDNVILQTMADGVQSAMRGGRSGVTLALKNLIKSGMIEGKVLAPITFAERYTASKDPTKNIPSNVFFHYTPDGTIEIYQVNQPKVMEAIRRSYEAYSPLWDLANGITSKIGMMHTRYNVAFHPYNFVRDAVTNSFIIAAEHGGKEMGDFIGHVATTVAGGGLFKAQKFASLYENGKHDELRAWINSSKDGAYIRDMWEFVERGGKVSFVTGLSNKTQHEELLKSVGPSKIFRTKEQLNKYIDIWSDMFELSARAAAYSASKGSFATKIRRQNPHMSEAEVQESAKNEATTYAKNLANFEQVGTYGKQAGALFMFFRPSMTGAIRAIDSIIPCLVGADSMIKKMPEAFRNDAVAVANFRKEHAELRQRATTTLFTIAAAGAGLYSMAYMMSDDDEQGRNKIATDDMSLWQRNARMPIPGMKDTYLNLPWGFGFGVMGVAGAQFMSVAMGKNTLKDAALNTAMAGMDSFLPLPISKISPLKNGALDSQNSAAWLVDTLTPSMLRPYAEFAMDKDALGRQIYNDRTSKYGDAYSGGENVPTMFKDFSRFLSGITGGGVDISPNTLNFFTNNYIDGISRIGYSTYGAAQALAGVKEFDPKADVAPLSSFLSRKANYDGREFESVKTQVEDLRTKLNMFADQPEQMSNFLSKHPEAPWVVKYYDSQANGYLRRINELKNAVNRNPSMTWKDRKPITDELTLQQNMLKRTIITSLGNFGIQP